MPGENGTKQLVCLILKHTAAYYFGVKHPLIQSAILGLHALLGWSFIPIQRLCDSPSSFPIIDILIDKSIPYR